MILSERDFNIIKEEIFWGDSFEYIYLHFIKSQNSNDIQLQILYLKSDECVNEFSFMLPIFSRQRFIEKCDKPVEYISSLNIHYLPLLTKKYLLKELEKILQDLSILENNEDLFYIFIDKKALIIEEFTIVLETINQIEKSLQTILKKLSKSDFNLPKSKQKELEKKRQLLFDKYIEKLTQTDTTSILENNQLSKTINILSSEIKKLKEVFGLIPSSTEIEQIISKKEQELKKLEQRQYQLKQYNKKSDITSLVDLEEEFFTSEEFQNQMEVEKDTLYQSWLENLLIKESLKELFLFFYDEENSTFLINSEELFKKVYEKMFAVAFEKFFTANSKNRIYILQKTKQSKIANDIYLKFERELILDNIYRLNFSNTIPQSQQKLFQLLYEKNRRFNYLQHDQDLEDYLNTKEMVEKIEEEASSLYYKKQREVYQYLNSLGIDGNDWQEEASRRGIQINYDLLLKDYEDVRIKIEDIVKQTSFGENPTFEEFEYFLENNNLNKFKSNTLQSIEDIFGLFCLLQQIETTKEEIISQNGYTLRNDNSIDFYSYMKDNLPTKYRYSASSVDEMMYEHEFFYNGILDYLEDCFLDWKKSIDTNDFLNQELVDKFADSFIYEIPSEVIKDLKRELF